MGNMISFVVPSYNNEKYVEYCVKSILNQTYQEFEIIAINDGSSDNTGAILNTLSRVDARISVFNINNSGVSAARNIGLLKAKGDYVVFVDGDDYLAQDYASYMIDLIQKDDADFALSKNCFESVKEKQVKFDDIQVLSPEKTTALLVSPVVKVGCWNKIYKKSFLMENNIIFNEKLFYGEGLFFITSVSQKCKFAVVGERKVYYYRRNNENSACTVFDINKIYNGEKSLELISNSIVLNDPLIQEMLYLHKCLFNAGALTKIRINKVKKRYMSDNKRWLAFNRCHLFDIIRSNNISLYRKLLIFCSCIAPGFLSLLEVNRRKRIKKNSV